MAESNLYHFSEDPGIKRFEPRSGRQIEGRAADEKLVWAIDEWHSPVYYFPRDCPRIMIWPIEGSTQDDIDRWIGSDARMAAYIEESWKSRFDGCELYRYTFDATGFESLNDHGVHVSPQPVDPLEVEPVGNLRDALERASVDLRVVPSLQPYADAWHSTLWFSGVRLRNAAEWIAPV